jgi:hypothetical protein
VAEEKKPSAPLPWLLLTGLLGVFAVNAPTAPTSTSNTAVAKKDEKKDEPPLQIAFDDPLKPVFDFHKTHDNRTMTPEEELRDHIHGYNTEFLIATVPDPIDSPYGYAFDQVVDAIQRAVEKKDGYILDRCWLPWDLDRKAKPKDGKEPERLREKKPGVLLFRHGRDTRRGIEQPGLCVVFLIGETPMGGVHKQALHNALCTMTQVGYDVDKPIRLIGPYFSGSQTSLQFVAGDWWKLSNNFYATFDKKFPPYRFQAISGNASAIRKKEFFSAEANKLIFPEWLEGGFEFSATVVPARQTLNAILHYLTRRDGTSTHDPLGSEIDLLPGKVALLTESNTGFGKAFSNLGHNQVLTLRFPLHISRVKNEYSLAAKKKDEQIGIRSDDPLASSIVDDQLPGEGIASQGGTTTTAANGMVLSRILSTISREQCKYVGVVASDTRDKLFLIRLIREYCPDVRIFVTEGDLLLTHPDYRYHMRGVIVGSTYPLVPRNQNWVNAEASERILFPTVGAQGYYNATLLHLGLNSQLLEYRAPAFALSDASRPEEADNRPPIWISMVAPSGSIVPLHLFTRYADKTDYVAKSTGTDVEEGTRFHYVGLDYPGSLLPVAIGLLAWWSYVLFQTWLNPYARLFWRGGSRLTMPDLFYRNIVVGSQTVLAAPIFAVAFSHAQSKHFESWWSNGFLGLAGMYLAGFAVGMVKPLLRRGITEVLRGRPLPGDSGILRSTNAPSDRVENLSWIVINSGLILAVIGCVAFFLGRFAAHGDFARRALYFVRASDLSSGLSPLTPLAFMTAAFCSWAFFQLKRSHIAERYHVPTPFPNGHEFRRVHEADRKIRGEIVHEAIALTHMKSIGTAMIVLFAFGMAIWLQSLPTIEGWAWDIVFFAGFLGLFLLSCTTLIRLFFLWNTTKQLLNSIASRPMMRAFSRMPSKVTEIFGKYLFTQRPLLSHMQVAAHQVRLLGEAAQADPDAPADLRSLVETADALDGILEENLAAGTSRTAVIRAMCMTHIVARGHSLPVDVAFGMNPEEKADASEPAWVRLAEAVAGTQVLIYVSQFFVQLRNLVLAAMLTSSLLLLAATSYPFHPEKLLLMGLIALSGGGVAGVVYVLFEMNRDELVSRATRSTPGKFSLDSGFIGSFFTYIVPTVGVLAAQLSGSFRWILEPLLRVMK